MQTTQFDNLLKNIQDDLKKYKDISLKLNQSIVADVENIPQEDRKFMTDIQERLNIAVTTGSTKEALKCKEELINYLNENGASHSGNRP